MKYLLFVLIAMMVIVFGTLTYVVFEETKANDTKYGNFVTLEKSCPTLCSLGLRGEMSIPEGLMLLERESKRLLGE